MSIQIDKEHQLPNAAGRSILELALEHGFLIRLKNRSNERCIRMKTVWERACLLQMQMF